MNIQTKIDKALVEGNLLEKTYAKIKKVFKKFFKDLFNGKMRKRFFAYIDRRLQRKALLRMSENVSIDNNKILFLMFSGDYSCNGKGICEEMLRQKVPYDLVWGIYKKQKGAFQYPVGVKQSVRGTYNFYRDLSSAKVIIDNGISTAHLNYQKKPEQILIETWHGSLGIKKFSPSSNNDKVWVKKCFKEASMTDYIISNSSFEDEVYREDYWKKTEIWRFGHARNDILFQTEKWPALRQEICREYNIPPENKICLYAPTFRDNGDLSSYCIDYDALSEALTERFGGTWSILIKFHYRILKKTAKYKFPESVINVSNYPDIQELMACTDVGITDYSSWICEFFLTRRPTFIFAADSDSYIGNERVFFFPLEELPSPVAYNVKTLIHNIKNYDAELYIKRCNEFLEDKGSVDDGHASERIVNKIREIMEESKK